MTQWGGILGPQPPQDSLTGDTNSHTNTLSHGVCNRICILQVPKLSTVHLFSFHWPSFCLCIDMSIRLLWKHIRSCRRSSLKFLLYVSTSQLTSQLEFFSLCIHSWSTTITLLRHLSSIFLLFSVIRNSPSFHVLHSPVYVPQLLLSNVSLKSSVLSLIFHIFFQ